MYHSNEYNAVIQYCESLSNGGNDLITSLERTTALKTLAPQMMSGAVQARFLEFLVSLRQPSSCLEIGTFTGYATIHMARALPTGASMISYEVNPEVLEIAREYVDRADLSARVELRHADALVDIPSRTELYDFVFMDGHKSSYAEMYEMLLPKMTAGALLLADNTLWSGKVARRNRDADTAALHAFNQHIFADPRVEVLLLPLRDGLSLITKK